MRVLRLTRGVGRALAVAISVAALLVAALLMRLGTSESELIPRPLPLNLDLTNLKPSFPWRHCRLQRCSCASASPRLDLDPWQTERLPGFVATAST